MNLSALIQRTRELLPDTLTPWVSDTMIVRYLNEAYKKVALMTNAIVGSYRVPIGRDGKIAFPTYISSLYTAVFNPESGQPRPLKILTLPQALSIFSHQSLQAPPDGVPDTLVIISPGTGVVIPKNIGIVAGLASLIPSADNAQAPLLNAPDTEPSFNEALHDCLAFWTASHILVPYDQHRNLANSLIAQFYDAVARLKERRDDFVSHPVSLYPPTVYSLGGNVLL